MEIIYPPLVEEGLKYYLEKTKQSLDKSTFYRSMVEKGIITETGLPTQHAIENGLVKDYYEDEGLSFDGFLKIYPVFEEYDEEVFQCINGYWEIPVDMKENLISQLESGELTFDAIQQTVFDSENFELIEREPQALKQLVMADRIFVSKKQNTSLSKREIYQREIKHINPLADIRTFTQNDLIQKEDFFNLEKFNQPLILENDSSKNSHEGEHHHHHQEHDFQSILLTSDQELNKNFLLQWIDWLIFTNQGKLYRFKGLISLQEHDFVVAMQGVNEQVNFQYTTQKKDQTTIILIGKKLDEEMIKLSFDKLISESKSR